MRDDAKLLPQIFGQMDCDNENIRLNAMNKAREILTASKTTFEEIYAKSLAARDEPTEPARTRSTSDLPATGPYLHDRVAKRFARTHEGKKVVRSEPPNGISGRIRVLSDVADDIPGFRKLKLSFETDQAIYEPFVLRRSDKDFLKAIQEHSRSGVPISFK
jgi:hypothetical protein